MRAILVRTGIDHSYGHWNAPIDPESGQFVYVPIPDGKKRYHQGMRRTYREIVPALDKFSKKFGIGEIGFPLVLFDKAMHLDPDFQTLTYGDNGQKRGSGIKQLSQGDILVFYASLRPIAQAKELTYALVGLYTVLRVTRADRLPPCRWKENAHTRWTPISPNDVVVDAIAPRSGRLKRCLPIGEWRNKSYRVRREILKKWGGLSVKDGYIQRSARPPEFLRPKMFLQWFKRQGPVFLRRNN